ncbi:MAG: T9SS type A sorting domain-containing protein, partial [Bacteroidota bacterium]|nr:T9SS type A sorting domain-containing protein [Bacteroidota bacterium]
AMSPSGNYIARVEGTTLNDGQNIYLFQFDRCSGEIEPIETIHTTTGYFTGAAFSPNEKYLYADDNNNLWQWDMQASDIASTQMLVDTFDGFVQPGWFGTIFGPLSNAPDGRIYISPASGSSEFMHVINQPDLASNDVQFIQHAFDFKVPFGRSSPNIPNYRLGPLDGSDCDTLGINNLPVAHFRFAENILGEKHTILFTDISYFDPETWHWDFGDGMTSSEIHPVHTFEDGLYHVCLTVSNANASDSTCQWVEILPTAIEEEMDSALPDLSISPNPFNEVLEIKSRSGIFRSTHLQLIDMHGQCLIEQTHAPVPVNLHVPHLPSGMYLCRIAEEDGTFYSFKVMKQ